MTRALVAVGAGISGKSCCTPRNKNRFPRVKWTSAQGGAAPEREPLLGGPLNRVDVIDELAGDKGFDGDAQREACIDNDVFPNIPNRKNRIDPWPYDKEGYKDRNRVERLFCKMKQFRRVATRYEKLKVTFLAMVQIALGFIRLRRVTN